jgi:aspartyl-tRNA(Asn)/glutamyl-tRNA(Gln) amidotransferase subunit B
MTSTPYTLICGLEIHAELKTHSKMFCGCKNDPFHAKDPNIHTCPVCLGMPGALPVANRTAIEWVLKLGLALNCTVNLFSKFDRKHYFYPDLPKGYQISQYDIPFCENGYLKTPEGRVRIRRIHLEEDTAKLQHTTIGDAEVSLIDFNRSSVPLVEVVSEPDIKSPLQAKLYAKKIRQVLRFLDVADCDMEQGGMRLEANISVQSEDERTAQQLPAYKVEVKNINSFRFLEQAIAFEVPRQTKVRESGALPIQETRGFNPTRGETFSQRTKEEAEDYRYFPDPDLPPVRFTAEYIETLQSTIPELPDAVLERLETTYGVESRFADSFVESPSDAQWLESMCEEAQRVQIKPNDVVSALRNKKINGSANDEPKIILQRYQALTAVSDISEAEVISAVKTVMTANPDAVAKYQAGDLKVLGFFMGQVMRELGKKVDANEIRAILQKVLN